MKPADRTLAKVILLHEVREAERREALARAAEGEARALRGEREGEARLREAAEAVAEAGRTPPPERAPAQVIEVQGRFLRRLREAAAARERQLAALRGERLTAEEAAARALRALARERRARERLEERLADRRRAAQRARARREEAAADELPPRGGGEGG